MTQEVITKPKIEARSYKNPELSKIMALVDLTVTLNQLLKDQAYFQGQSVDSEDKKVWVSASLIKQREKILYSLAVGNKMYFLDFRDGVALLRRAKASELIDMLKKFVKKERFPTLVEPKEDEIRELNELFQKARE